MHPRISPPAALVRRLACIACGAALVLTGCATAKRPAPGPAFAEFQPMPVVGLEPIDPALLQRPTGAHRLGPGDVLDIEVVGDASTRTRTTVGPDGKIYFYILPGIDVWGMTVAEARARLVREMGNYVREEQPISMSLRTAASSRIWVLGRLNKPGVYNMAGPMTLLEAIAQAGGPAPAAGIMTAAGTVGLSNGRGASDEAVNYSRSFVIRQGKALRVDFDRLLHEGDMSQNIYLQPDDFIYLPSEATGPVHILGAVNNPRALDYTGQLSLAQAIAESGGLLTDAYPAQVAVVRGSLTEPQVAVFDLTAILHGQAADVLLAPQDIVFVPHAPYRALTRYVNQILDTFARTVGINEGARAASGNVGPVGVNVPLQAP